MHRLRQAISAAALLAGAGLLVAIFSKVGPGAISQALAPVGWNIVPIILCHGFPMLFDTLGWRLLFLGHRRPSLYMLTRARWIGEAINNLLPVAHIGGELVRVRLAALAGSKPIHAAASVLADITLGAATQILFGLSGIILLAAAYERISMLPIIIGLGIAACSITALLSLKGQRSIVAISRSAQRFLLIPRWARGFGGMGEFREALAAICGSGHVLSLACSWRLVGWFAGTGEIFLSLHFLGHAATWTDAIILESIVQLSRSLAFAIPGGIGIQEASFVAVGSLLGLEPTTGLALALIRRASTVALGLPALAVYWFVEARRAVAVASR
jgi:putative membrane protein